MLKQQVIIPLLDIVAIKKLADRSAKISLKRPNSPKKSFPVVFVYTGISHIKCLAIQPSLSFQR
jgi:hypothetical protein